MLTSSIIVAFGLLLATTVIVLARRSPTRRERWALGLLATAAGILFLTIATNHLFPVVFAAATGLTAGGLVAIGAAGRRPLLFLSAVVAVAMPAIFATRTYFLHAESDNRGVVTLPWAERAEDLTARLVVAGDEAPLTMQVWADRGDAMLAGLDADGPMRPHAAIVLGGVGDGRRRDLLEADRGLVERGLIPFVLPGVAEPERRAWKAVYGRDSVRLAFAPRPFLLMLFLDGTRATLSPDDLAWVDETLTSRRRHHRFCVVVATRSVVAPATDSGAEGEVGGAVDAMFDGATRRALSRLFAKHTVDFVIGPGRGFRRDAGRVRQLFCPPGDSENPVLEIVVDSARIDARRVARTTSPSDDRWRRRFRPLRRALVLVREHRVSRWTLAASGVACAFVPLFLFGLLIPRPRDRDEAVVQVVGDDARDDAREVPS